MLEHLLQSVRVAPLRDHPTRYLFLQLLCAERRRQVDAQPRRNELSILARALLQIEWGADSEIQNAAGQNVVRLRGEGKGIDCDRTDALRSRARATQRDGAARQADRLQSFHG